MDLTKKPFASTGEELANAHFADATKKVFISYVESYQLDKLSEYERKRYIKSFRDYLSKRYRDNCYYYSTYAILGLDDSAQLVRGIQTTQGDRSNCYRHGWVNFNFEGEEFIFDSMVNGIITKAEWDKYYTPKITASTSRKEILDYFLSDRRCHKNGNIWTTKMVQPSMTMKQKQITVSPYSRFIMSTKGLKADIEKCIIFNQPSW